MHVFGVLQREARKGSESGVKTGENGRKRELLGLAANRCPKGTQALTGIETLRRRRRLRGC